MDLNAKPSANGQGKQTDGMIEKCPEGTFIGFVKSAEMSLDFKYGSTTETERKLKLLTQIVETLAAKDGGEHEGKLVEVTIKWLDSPDEGPQNFERMIELCKALGTPDKFDENDLLEGAKAFTGKAICFSHETKEMKRKGTGEKISYSWFAGFSKLSAKQEKNTDVSGIKLKPLKERYRAKNWIQWRVETKGATVPAAVIAKYDGTMFDFSGTRIAAEDEEAPF